MSEEAGKRRQDLSDLPEPAQNPEPRLREPLRWLVCPVCHEELDAEVGGIRCLGCGRLYPIVDGLPVLLRDRAI